MDKQGEEIISFRTKLWKSGNSYVITIPPMIVKTHQFRAHEIVDVTVSKKELFLGIMLQKENSLKAEIVQCLNSTCNKLFVACNDGEKSKCPYCGRKINVIFADIQKS